MTSQKAKKGPKKSSSPFDLFRFLTGDEKVFIRPHLRCFFEFLDFEQKTHLQIENALLSGIAFQCKIVCVILVERLLM